MNNRVYGAVSDADLRAIYNGTPLYDPDSTSTGCGATPSVAAGASGNINLQGNDNPEKAWNYFIGKGLTPEQTAGILGNLKAESGINPQNVQGSKDPDTPDPSNITVGWGLIQWTPGSKVLNVAKQANITTPIYELGTQLELVWWHLNNTTPTGRTNVLPGLKATTTIADATRYFEDKVEGAGIINLPVRIGGASYYYNMFSGKTAPPVITSSADPSATTTSDTATTSDCPLVTSSSGNDLTIDGFTIYWQNDPAWKDKPYSTTTVGASGCGPSAMAMIITTLTGQRVTPDVTADYAASQNLYIKDQGSSWNLSPVLAEHWGLKADKISKSITDISQALSAGKFVILTGEGEFPLKTDGHFLVIRGITADGQLLIGDSGHQGTSDKPWDAQFLLGNAKEGSAYAIYK